MDCAKRDKVDQDGVIKAGWGIAPKVFLLSD